MTTKQWQWDQPCPTTACDVSPAIARHLVGLRPTYTAGSGTSQVAATGGSSSVEAWRVMHTQIRERLPHQCSDFRDRTIGWIVRTTFLRQGEAPTAEYRFVPGKDRPKLDTFDCRFAEAVETWEIGDSVQLSAIRAHFPAE